MSHGFRAARPRARLLALAAAATLALVSLLIGHVVVAQAHSGAPRARIDTPFVNSFHAGIFGIAAGGNLQNEPSPMLDRDLGDDHRAGARWVRLDVNWAQIQPVGPHAYSWQVIDRAVSAARARHLNVLGTLIYTPAWARPAHTESNYQPRTAAFARFAAAAARHLGRAGVTHFEIWNEPNTTVFWAPRPSTAAYARRLIAADRAIKQVAPQDTVVTGGTAPAPDANGEISPVDFLRGVYRHGGRGHFDAVGHHPYCWPAYPGAAAEWSAWYQMYGTHPSLRSVMLAHGDGSKRIWATEFGAPTGGPRGSYVSDAVQARMIVRAYNLFASYRWAGPLFLYQGRDAGGSHGSIQNFFGFINHDFSPKPSFTAYRSLAATL